MADGTLQDQGWYTTSEAAAWLGIKRIYVDKMMRRGWLPRRVLAGRLLFHLRDLEAYQRSHPRLGRKYRKAS